MKRDLKINFGTIISIANETQTYRDALETMEQALIHIHNILNQNKAKSIDEVSYITEDVRKNILKCKEELRDIHLLFWSYNYEMQAIIKPQIENEIMRVDSNDIYWNKRSFNNACYIIDDIPGSIFDEGKKYEYTSDGKIDSKVQEQNRKNAANYDKLVAIDQMLKGEAQYFHEFATRMDKLYQKAVDFENCDDYYKGKASELTNRYGNSREEIRGFFTSVGTGTGNILRGAGDAIVGSVVGVLTLVGTIYLFLEGTKMSVWYHVLGKEDKTPDWATEGVENGKALGKGLVEILIDPVNAFNATVQDLSDTIDEEGICYGIGLALPEIAELILLKGGGKAATGTIKAAEKASDVGLGVKTLEKTTDTAKIKVNAEHLNVTKGAGKAESVLGKIDFSKLDKNEVKDLINKIDKSILLDEDKIIANIEIYNNAIEAGVKVDIQVIASPKFIDSSGRIKWPDESGYTIDTITGKAIKNEVIPKKGDIIDRYGSPNGTFTSPINNNVSIPYEQRALPYLENKNAYHQYKITRNFDELSEAIKSCKDKDLVEMINADALRYGINLDNLKTYGGEIAPAFDAIGGGTQWQLPLSVDYLIKLGFLKEIK